MTVKCRICGTELKDYNDEREWKVFYKAHGHICRPCWNARMKKWYIEHPEVAEKRKRRFKDYMRNHYISTGDNRNFKVEGKRPYTGYCELCKKTNRKLEYHHWDDSDFSKGLWLCYRCHQIAEDYEKGRTQMYLHLKESIEKER